MYIAYLTKNDCLFVGKKKTKKMLKFENHEEKKAYRVAKKKQKRSTVDKRCQLNNPDINHSSTVSN